MVMSTQDKQHIRNYLENIDLSRFIGVSLTMKQNVDGQKLDPISSSQNLRHFMNLLNKKVHGNRFSRYGLKLQIFPVLESSVGDRLHYHMIVESPLDIRFERFKHIVHTLCMSTRFGYRELHIDQTIDDGWIKYITKFHHTEDQVDWENVHLKR